MEVEFSKVDEEKQLHSMVLLPPHNYHFCFSVALTRQTRHLSLCFQTSVSERVFPAGCNEMLGAPGCNERAVGGGKQSQQLAPPCHCIVQVLSVLFQVLCVLFRVPCCAIISRQH